MKDHPEILRQLENLCFLSEKIKGVSFALWESLTRSDTEHDALRAYAAYTVYEMSEDLSRDFRASLDRMLHIS